MSISQTITSLPTPPSRADPEEFDSRADAFLGALPDLTTEINAWAAEVNSTADSIDDAKEAAQAAAEATETLLANAQERLLPDPSALPDGTMIQVINGAWVVL